MSGVESASRRLSLTEGGRCCARGRRRAALIALVALAVELVGLRRRGYAFGGKVVVRCREGHLFTTIWIPGASVKAARLGWWRLQRCPVGRHWSLVAPVRRSDLGAEDLRRAGESRDIRVP